MSEIHESHDMTSEYAGEDYCRGCHHCICCHPRQLAVECDYREDFDA